MEKLRYLIITAVIILIAALVSWAVIPWSSTWQGTPIILIACVYIFAIQWLAFIPAYLMQTEKFYDLVGSLTYISSVGLMLLLNPSNSTGALLIAALVAIWAARLGTFLFVRISQDGGDSRFDAIKPNAPRFFLVWNIQGLWVFLTLAAALMVLTSNTAANLGIVSYLGLLLWVVGFAIEVIADRQKRQFRKQRTEQGGDNFIQSGLWAYSRHPNYFGEIVLWLGIAVIALPSFTGWQFLGLISPVFVTLLLTRVSGVPLLEAKADARFGERSDYQRYKQEVPVLFPSLRAFKPE